MDENVYNVAQTKTLSSIILSHTQRKEQIHIEIFNFCVKIVIDQRVIKLVEHNKKRPNNKNYLLNYSPMSMGFEST